MYNEDGLLYCQDFGNFSCVDAYGFTSSQIIDTWMCGSTPLVEEDLTLRSVKSEELEVSVYPNPSRDVFYVESNDDGELDITVYDLSGRQVYFHYGEGQLSLLDGIPGVYVLRIQSGKRSQVVRLLLL